MSDTLCIAIPAEATLTISSPNGDRLPWVFDLCVRWIVDSNPAFNQTGPGIRQGARIIDAIQGAEGSSRPLACEDVVALDKAMNEPAAGYHPPFFGADGERANIPARIFLPYLDAVADALKPK